MSDDERDYDIESAEKRAHHNALERKRRDHIKDSFSSLRDSVPSLQGEKVASRAQILKKAADYIQFMRRKNASHQQDIDDLKRQNAILEAQIRTLEKAKVTGNFAAESSSEMGLEDGAYSHHPGESETDTSDSESGRMMGSGGRKTKKMRVNGLEYK
ncbi:protein max isoform X2 [Diaphorina citri]|uniref:Protein max n=1 Tax=Diaphorina citri TaxID=121845 RepID=A0A1S3DGH2_DIACI|nr:protein max isoform X1 [Diaphorina citri]XP_026685640.1 protein max isoform X2 [Diaphorina citri]